MYLNYTAFTRLNTAFKTDREYLSTFSVMSTEARRVHVVHDRPGILTGNAARA
jgi:hypothetical protein